MPGLDNCQQFLRHLLFCPINFHMTCENRLNPKKNLAAGSFGCSVVDILSAVSMITADTWQTSSLLRER
jgi:hypothetical protein